MYGVELTRPIVACTAAARRLRGMSHVRPFEHLDPHVDVLPLQQPDPVRVGRLEVMQFASVHDDQIGLLQREGHLLVHQAGHRLLVRSGARDAVASANQQSLADVHQHGCQQRLLAGVVPVDRRTRDPRGGTDVVDRGRSVAALSEQPRRLGSDVARSGRRLTRRHGFTLTNVQAADTAVLP